MTTATPKHIHAVRTVWEYNAPAKRASDSTTKPHTNENAKVATMARRVREKASCSVVFGIEGSCIAAATASDFRRHSHSRNTESRYTGTNTKGAVPRSPSNGWMAASTA